MKAVIQYIKFVHHDIAETQLMNSFHLTRYIVLQPFLISIEDRTTTILTSILMQVFYWLMLSLNPHVTSGN
jgi:hypothetical protein